MLIKMVSDDWDKSSFPHRKWESPLVFVNNKETPVELVEWGICSRTGQKMLMIKFNHLSRLNLWHRDKYAIWTKCAMRNFRSISTCPKWKKKCRFCYVTYKVFEPPDMIDAYICFCETEAHEKIEAPLHIHVVIQNFGFIQKRLGD